MGVIQKRGKAIMEIIYGRNTVESYLKNNKSNARKLWVLNVKSSDKYVAMAKRNKIAYELVSKSKLDSLCKEKHQGLVLEIKDYEYVSLEKIVEKKENNLIVICDQIEDPHNLGAILRTCDAVAVDGLIISKHRSASLNATVAKVSTGAINTVDVHQATNLNDSIKYLKDHGYWIVAAENGIDAVNYTDFPVDMPIALVVGSEGKGISRLVLEASDIKTTIPMKGSVNSLNVSVATAILLFEIERRR